MNKTILIVDDSKTERVILRAFLQGDYTPLEAGSGEEALALLDKKAAVVSAILMDVLMPGMDGFETMNRIKANADWFAIPIIVTTGMDDEESREKAVAYGADSFVTKPFNRQLLLHVLSNAIRLRETAAIADAMTRDKLTGLLNRESFATEAGRMIRRRKEGYYTLSCFNVENFKVINDQYGTEVGDEVLRHIARNLSEFVISCAGLAGRNMADQFMVLLPAKYKSSAALNKNYARLTCPPCVSQPIRVRIGRYLVTDRTLPVSTMYDRACIAECTVRGRFDVFRADYTDTMRDELLEEQQIVNDMIPALQNGEFEPWFQPQYNHASGALIGAEALIRWRKDGKIILPIRFIPVFERNGFIYEMDKYIWRQVCICLRRWLDDGKKPLPVSVNISRYDILQNDFVSTISTLVRDYSLPPELLRLEITETAFSASLEYIVKAMRELVALGFTVEIDDFGTGFSSLNTLKDVPATILKLDMKFFASTENSQRGGNIVESVVRMAKWLGMTVIAEGVEEKEQADYLKSIGCNYIQGYYYSRPVPLADYERLLAETKAEPKLAGLKTLATLDNNTFWDPQSMDTLIFNTYAGAACILEFSRGRIELLRATDNFIKVMSTETVSIAGALGQDMCPFMDSVSVCHFSDTVLESAETKENVNCEIELTDVPGYPAKTYLRLGVRVIATTNDRYLVYCLVDNLTAQREAERQKAEVAERLSAIMGNISGSVSAFTLDEAGNTTLIFSNENYFGIFGYTKEQAAERHLDIMSCVIPDDFDSVLTALHQVQCDGRPRVIDYRAQKRDGGLAYIRANTSRMHMEGYGDKVIVCVEVDISESMAMQDQLQAIVQNINGGVCATYHQSGKDELVLVNEKYYDIIGYTKEQLAAEVTSILDLVHPHDRLRVERLLREGEDTQQPYSMEYRIIRRNGAIRHILCNTSMIHLFGVSAPVQLAVSNDITQLREAQQKERELAQQLRAVMDNLQGGITATVFRNGSFAKLLFANEGYYQLFGYTRDQYKTEVPSTLELILPEDRERIVQSIGQTVRTCGSTTYEYRCRKRDGSMIWVQTTNSVLTLGEDGDVTLLAAFTDITALRRADLERIAAMDKLQAVMNGMGSGITAVVFHGEQMEFLFTNRRYYELLGVTKEDYDLIYLNDALAFIHPEDRLRIRGLITEANVVGTQLTTEFRIVRPDSVQRWISCTINVTRISGVSDVAQVSVYTDITARKEAEEQLHFLNDTAYDILAQPDADAAVYKTLDSLLTYAAGDRAYVVELAVGRKTYEISADHTESDPQNLPLGVTADWFLAGSRDIAILNADALDDQQTPLRELLAWQNIHTIAITPLWREGKLVGYVGIDNPTRAAEQLGRLKVLADYISLLLSRRDLMQKIKSDRESLQTLMNDTPGGFVRLKQTGEGKFIPVYANDGFAAMLGASHESLLSIFGEDVLKGVHPDDRAMVQRIGARMMARGVPGSGRFRILSGRGQYLWLTFNGKAVRDSSGESFLNVYYTDATKQVSQEQFGLNLLDNLPFGAALYSYDGEHLKAIHQNKRYWQLVGRAPIPSEEISVFGSIHPDDRPLILHELAACVRQKRNVELILRIRCGSDDYVPLQTTANVVPGKDGGYLIYAAFRSFDSGIKAVQELLPAALAASLPASDEMVFVKDTHQRYLCCSEAQAKSLQLQSSRDIVGKTDFDLINPYYAAIYVAKGDEVLQTGEALIGEIETYYLDDRGLATVRASIYPIFDPMSEVIGLYGMGRDITVDRENAARSALAASVIPGGFATYYIRGDSLCLASFTDGFCQPTGLSREEYKKLAAHDPLARIADEDREKLRAQLARLREAPVGEVQDVGTYRRRCGGGNLRTYSLKLYVTERGEDFLVVNAIVLDVTQQADVKQKLRELIDHLPCGAAVCCYNGKELRLVHINSYYSLLLGCEPGDGSGKLCPQNLVHPGDRAVIGKEMLSAIAEHRKAACDVRLLDASGKYRAYHLVINPRPLDNGTHLLYITFFQISDSELALETASAQLQLLTDSIPGGIATFHFTKNTMTATYFNEGLCTLTGYPRAEFFSQQIDAWSFILEEDRPEVHRQITQLIAQGTPLDCCCRIRTKSGSYLWLGCKATTATPDGDGYTISAVLTDISAQQEEKEHLRLAEEEYRIATMHGGRTICRYNIAEKTVTVAEDAAQRLGLPVVVPDVPEGRVKLGVISPDTAPAYLEFFGRVLQGEAQSSAVFRMKINNKWRWINATATDIFDSMGKPVSAIVSYADITEQREKEFAYSRWLNSIKERSEDSYTLFRCNITRDTSFDAWEGRLLPISFDKEKLSFNDRTNAFVEKFVYAEDRERYRTFFRSDSLLAEYYRGHRSHSLDFREILDDGALLWLRVTIELVEYPNSREIEAYILYENIDEAKSAELQNIERAETDPLTGALNRAAFAEKVNRIISTSKPGALHALLMLDIDGFKQINDVFGHGAGDHELISIADMLSKISRKSDLVARLGGDEFLVFLPEISGREIAARKAAQICELTRKTFSVNVSISGSVGIALYPQDGEGFETLYKAADKTMYRVKDAGKNSFAFMEDKTLSTCGHEEESASAIDKRRAAMLRRMLIVDDNKLDQLMLKNMFRETYRIEIAKNGEEALIKLRNFRNAISVMLLDLNMPGMDGFAVMRQMQKSAATEMIPVVVVSGIEDREVALSAIRAGATDFITKPVDPDVLRIRVESAISKAENERLRAQNSLLSMQSYEAENFRIALEQSGIMVVVYDWIKQSFTYSALMSKQLMGCYDKRSLWKIWLTDMVTDTKTVQKAQELVHTVAEDREQMNAQLTVRLKTTAGKLALFDMYIHKELNEYGLSSRMIITFQKAAKKEDA